MSETQDSNPVNLWLLDADPAIRWQVMRDLLGKSKKAVELERRKLAHEGWGARLLNAQDPKGTWAGGQSPDAGLYTPKWTSTTYTMLMLRDFGLPATNPQAKKACAHLLNGGFQRDGGIGYGSSESHTCITGMVASILSYFEFDDDRLDRIADWLLKQQMPDGGWNCRRPTGAKHSSMHSTISVLEGLRQYELHRGRGSVEVKDAQQRGREFLLVHRLFRSHRTGEVIKPIFTRFSHPPRWHYDILRALDYFREINARRDERLSDAIDIVQNSQDREGRWPLQNRWNGKTYFEMERLGEPSRWNTLRALRVLKWWDRRK